MATNGAVGARGLSACSDRANSSLPVPLSPFEQDGRIGRRRALQRRKHLPQGSVLADQLRRAATNRQLLAQQQVLRDDAPLLQRACHEQQEMIGIDGFGEKVERAFLHRRHRVLDAAVGSHHDDRDIGVDLLGRAQHAEAITIGKP